MVEDIEKTNMNIDNKFIELISHDDTLNKEQFKILDLPFPALENWKELALQKEVSRNDANMLMLLKGKLALTAQKQIVKKLNTAYREFENAFIFIEKSRQSYKSLKSTILAQELQSSQGRTA